MHLTRRRQALLRGAVGRGDRPALDRLLGLGVLRPQGDIDDSFEQAPLFYLSYGAVVG